MFLGLLLAGGALPLLTVPLFQPDPRFFSSWVPLLVIMLALGLEKSKTAIDLSVCDIGFLLVSATLNCKA
jgi:hypothetical protein